MDGVGDHDASWCQTNESATCCVKAMDHHQVDQDFHIAALAGLAGTSI